MCILFIYFQFWVLAARLPSIFNSIMHMLSRRIGLISITLAQSGMECALTSLPDHRWQRSSSPSLEKCPAVAGGVGGGSSKSALIIALAPLALRCVLSHPFHIAHTPPLIHFPGKNELPSSHSEHRDYGKLQAVGGGECGLLSQGCRCHRHACSFPDWNITLREMKVTLRCIDWGSVVFHGPSQWGEEGGGGFFLFNEGLLPTFSDNRASSLKSIVCPMVVQSSPLSVLFNNVSPGLWRND